MKATGSTTKLMVTVFTLMLTAHDMKACGKTISNMVTAEKVGLMEAFMKENTLLAKNTELASINGMTALATMESGMKTKLKVLVSILG